MQMSSIPFGTTDWSEIPEILHAGETGTASWRTCQFGELRVRMVSYSAGYLADHWCTKGHILLCLEGELHTEIKDGRTFTLKPGMSYQVADNIDPTPLIHPYRRQALYRRLTVACQTVLTLTKYVFNTM